MNELHQKIASLHPWFYDVVIGGIQVVPGIGARQKTKELIARTRYRETILVDEVVKYYDFTNKSLLDIASNCGYWSSHYVRHGATSLYAVEGRPEYVDQGRLYWETNDFCPNFTFSVGDVTTADTWKHINENGPYDFTLCCGILYHIASHDLLLARINDITREAVLIDTRVSPPEHKKAKLFYEKGGCNWDAIGVRPPAKHPTLESLYHFFESHNYNVMQLQSPIAVHPDMVKNDNYDAGRRIALLCTRKTINA